MKYNYISKWTLNKLGKKWFIMGQKELNIMMKKDNLVDAKQDKSCGGVCITIMVVIVVAFGLLISQVL